MAGPLDALERFMEEAVEGTMLRLFRPKLQPVQLAKAAARRMEEQQDIGPSGPEVPNSYAISLNPRDFDRFTRFQVALQRALEKYLDKYARDRGWHPVSSLSVRLLADSAVPAGRPRVVAQMLDSPDGAAWSEPVEQELPIEQTVRQAVLDPRREGGSVAASPAGAYLLDQSGQRYDLARPIVTLGRALENDIVIPDTRVSRFHAEIQREGSRFVLRDLASTNGTQVANQPAERHDLADGETISLGGYRVVFHRI